MFLNLQQPQPSMNLNSNGNKYDFILAVLTYAESHDFLPHTLGFEHIHTFDYEWLHAIKLKWLLLKIRDYYVTNYAFFCIHKTYFFS